MAYSDDVAEKIADFLLNSSLQTAVMAGNVAPGIVSGISAVGSGIKHSLEQNKELRELMSYEGEIPLTKLDQILSKRGERASSICIGDSDANDYEKLLTDYGVTFAKLDKLGDNCKMYVYLSRNDEQVKKASQALVAHRNVISELRPDLYFNSLTPDNVHVIEGVSNVELELFRHYARSEKLLFTAMAMGNGYRIVCDKADEGKAQMVLLKTGWALSGDNKELVKSQAEDRISERSRIRRAIDDKEELYIVSKKNPGNYIRIDEEGYKVFKKGKEVSSLSRSDSDFDIKCLAQAEALYAPCVLSAAEFAQGLTKEKLESHKTLEFFPETYKEKEELERIETVLQLVSQKSALDDEYNATFGIWDTSVSYSEFATQEALLDEDERDDREKSFEHLNKAVEYSKSRHNRFDLDMNEKNIDYLIAKAEEKKREMAKGASKEKEKDEASHKPKLFDFQNR